MSISGEAAYTVVMLLGLFISLLLAFGAWKIVKSR